MEFLKYRADEPLPPMIFKKLEELNTYDDEVILKTFQEMSEDIRSGLSNNFFKNDMRKLNYVFAIVQNSISEVRRRMDWYKRQKEKQDRQFDSFDIDSFNQWCMMDDSRGRYKPKDISKCLEPEDL
jgi:hypothetical protein